VNERERVLAVLRRQRPDRVPWVARLELWYNARIATGTMPERFRGCSLWEIDRALGIGIRVLAEVVKLQTDGFETRTTTRGDEILTEYITPIGTVTTRQVYNEMMRSSGITSPYLTEHIIKCPDDYDVAEYIFEHTRPVPCYENYQKIADQVGGDGFVLGGKIECPYQHWLVRLTGYETAFAHLHDFGARTERFLRFLTDWTREVYRVMVDSPAEVILSGDNFDGRITHPGLFRKYCAPFFKEFASELHERGKWLASHIDGDPLPLLQVFPESGIDIAESLAPAPMTRAELTDAQRIWGGRMRIWSGIPSAILCPSTSEEDFERFVDDLFNNAVPAGNLILGVGDNIVADAILDRVIRISELVRERGNYQMEN
jgi:uroporphyrinogen-III decarboxylase